MSNIAIYKKVAICVLVRDCEEALPNLLQKIELLRKNFSDSRVFIIENNSVDASKDIITDYQKSSNGVVINSFSDPNLDRKERIERMVYIRNLYLKLVKSETQFTPDYLIAIDGDIDFKVNGIVKSIVKAPKDWVSLSANGRYYLKFFGIRIPVLYYDLFALLPIDCDNIMLTNDELLENRPKVHRAIKDNDYVKCKSGFGGVTVYKYDIISDQEYILIENKASENLEKHICEHVPFNINILRFGNNYICRDMLTYYERISYALCLRIILKKILMKKS